MTKTAIWLGAAALALASGAARAAVVSLAIIGECHVDCAYLGLADGAGIGGTVVVDDAFFAADGTSGNEALVSYSFAFGSFAFDDKTAPDPGFSISWGSSPGSIFGLLISSFVSDVRTPAPLLELYLYSDLGGSGHASNTGWQVTLPFFTETMLGEAVWFTLEPLAPAAVPLPAAGLLLAGGLAAAAAVARRRR